MTIESDPGEKGLDRNDHMEAAVIADDGRSVFHHGGKPCPGCGETRWQAGPSLPSWPSLLERDNPRMLECAVCGTAHLPDVQLEDYVTNAPATHGEVVTHTEKARRNLQEIYPLLESHLPGPGPRALVLGCSTGFEIEALLRSPFDFSVVDGLDANRRAVEMSRAMYADRPNVTIHQAYVEEFRGSYEFVSATMVLEHIPDPFEAMLGIARQQPAGGVVAIQVPRYDNRIPHSIRTRTWYYVMDAHLWYFTRRGFVQMIDRCGYDVIAVQNAPRFATPGFALDKIIRGAVRHIGPYFIRDKSASADWERLGHMQDWIERKIDRISEMGSHVGLGFMTSCLRMGFLNDAMTVFARKKPDASLGRRALPGER